MIDMSPKLLSECVLILRNSSKRKKGSKEMHIYPISLDELPPPFSKTSHPFYELLLHLFCKFQNIATPPFYKRRGGANYAGGVTITALTNMANNRRTQNQNLTLSGQEKCTFWKKKFKIFRTTSHACKTIVLVGMAPQKDPSYLKFHVFGHWYGPPGGPLVRKGLNERFTLVNYLP